MYAVLLAQTREADSRRGRERERERTECISENKQMKVLIHPFMYTRHVHAFRLIRSILNREYTLSL